MPNYDALTRYVSLMVAGILIILSSTPQAAIASSCTKKVISTTIEAGNVFQVDVGSWKWQICRLDDPLNVSNATYGAYQVSQLSCQALVTEFMSAKAQDKNVEFYFSNACPAAAIDNSDYPYAIVFN
ncbi:hypothetical protein [Sphingomonas sp. DT-204]|uniref:hypothetical protein n=1 Tax=Sphingomonas sp. DT-204 TaxID=3396166 RepID=UPI003F1AA18C